MSPWVLFSDGSVSVVEVGISTQLNSTQRASMDAGPVTLASGALEIGLLLLLLLKLKFTYCLLSRARFILPYTYTGLQ